MGTKIIATSAQRRVQSCDTCDRRRFGVGATGWPAGDDICPTCRRIIERAEAAGVVTTT